MTDRHKQPCPFCQRIALFSYTDRKNRKYFSCDQCTEFEISAFAERQVANAPDDRRLALSNQSKTAPDGCYLTLSRPASDGPNAAVLIGKYLPKSR